MDPKNIPRPCDGADAVTRRSVIKSTLAVAATGAAIASGQASAQDEPKAGTSEPDDRRSSSKNTRG